MKAPRFKFYNMPKNIVLVLQYLFGSLLFNNTGRAVERFSDIFGMKNIILISQCRIGIYLAVQEIIKSTGKTEVILPAYTIYDVVNMVILAGGKPVFCDVRAQTGNINEDLIEETITDETGAILVPHLHGICANASKIRSICDKRKIFFIEDVAQGLGAKHKGKYLGEFGDISVFSFGRAKNVNAFFGGGIVIKNQKIRQNVANRVASWKKFPVMKFSKRVFLTTLSHIATTQPIFSILTFNIFKLIAIKKGENALKALATENSPFLRSHMPDWYLTRMTNLQAFLVYMQLSNVLENNKIRSHKAKMYATEFTDLAPISALGSLPSDENIYLQYPIVVTDRYAFGKSLLNSGVDVAFQHLNDLSSVDCFRKFNKDCPNARMLSQSVVLLPTYPKFKTADVRKIISSVKDVSNVS